MLTTPVTLLERLRNPREPSAWDRFAELYSPLLFHWAKRLGEQDSDAADLVQDVFLILWRNLPTFEYDAARSFHAWLRTLFLNRAKQRLRDRRRIADSPELTAFAKPADVEAEEKEYRQYLLHRAFTLMEREFAPQHVKVFREHVLEGRAADDVAKELGLSPGTVYCIKSRILNRLRQDLSHLLE